LIRSFARCKACAYEAAVVGANCRSNLFHLHAHDWARLKNYCSRPELDQVYLDLLQNREQWALHFIGDGGTGKSMLIRHLALEISEDKRVAVSRVDFDYLNSDYSESDPVLCGGFGEVFHSKNVLLICCDKTL
jgi:hypothetical protein